MKPISTKRVAGEERIVVIKPEKQTVS